MTIAVTGASGWLGSEVCRRLVEIQAAPFADRSNISSRRMDLTDPASVEQFVASSAEAGAQALIHCAARVHRLSEASADPAREYERVNVQGTRVLALAAKRSGIRRFVFVSSIKVNGEATKGNAFRGGDVPAPEDDYGRSKRIAEDILVDLFEPGKFEPVILRPPLLYGAGVKANFRTLVRSVLIRRPIPLAYATENRRSVAAMRNFADVLAQAAIVPWHKVSAVRFTFADHAAVSTCGLVEELAAAAGVRPLLLPVPLALLRAGARIVGRSGMIDRLTGSLEVDGSALTDALDWIPRHTRSAEIRATVDEVRLSLMRGVR